MVDSYQIGRVKSWQARQLKKLFDQALVSDFSYFPASYIDCVRRQNSFVKLSSATLKSDRLLLGMWVEQHLVGYVIAKLSGNDKAYIFWLYIAPQCRGQALGKTLLNSAISIFNDKKIKRIELVTHNRKDFYLSSGFIVDKLATNFIDDVDVYMMSRELA